MKKLLLSLGACLCFCCTMYGQSLNSINPALGTRGQSLTVSIIGSGTNFSTATSTMLGYGQTSTLYPVSWQALSNTQIVATYSIPPNATIGPWDVIVRGNFPEQMLAGGFFIGTGLPNGNYAQVRGKVYRDANANCVYNSGEPTHNQQTVTIMPGPYVALTDVSGNYNAWLPLGSYTAELFAPFPYTNTCPSNGQIPFSLTTNGQVVAAQNFGTDNIPYTDVRITTAGIRLRPGFDRNQWIEVDNIGNTMATNAVVKYVKPSFTSFGLASPAVSTINGDTAIWNLSNWGAHATLSVRLNTPVNIPIGTPYEVYCSVTPSPMDIITYNNTYTFEDTVTNAIDPNDKQVFTVNGQNANGDVSVNDSLLRYMVRFQNTGTDTAYNIFVRDTLDIAHLDLGTLRILGASHPYHITLSPDGKLELYFANIMLPDSGANQAGSNGYFMYEAETRHGLPLGTVIPNSASIYFDFNAPVLTNTVHTRICDSLAAGFMASLVGPTMQFMDQSAGTVSSWYWDFGDGNTSTQQSPSHQYAIDGNYTVCLYVQGACGADTICNTVTVCGMPVTAAYNSSTTGLSAAFTNNSSNGQSYSWDFGDGNSSTAANPSHTYATVGTYQVCLTATSACGTIGTHCSNVFVCVPPTANWNFTQPSTGTLNFTDGSQYATSWAWDFGNGASSGAQNPSHTYTVNGTYTICLIASNGCGSDTSCTTATVCPAPLQAAFSSSANQYTYTFTDQSLGGIQYAWDFGDGSTATIQNPVHTYAANGTYNVCQTVTNLCGSTHTLCQPFSVNVVGVEGSMPGFEITVMPNPMQDEAMVMVSHHGMNGPYAFELYDVRGAHVRHESGQLNTTLIIHRTGLAKGIYSFRIVQDGITLGVGRLMVE